MQISLKNKLGGYFELRINDQLIDHTVRAAVLRCDEHHPPLLELDVVPEELLVDLDESAVRVNLQPLLQIVRGLRDRGLLIDSQPGLLELRELLCPPANVPAWTNPVIE